MSIRKKLIVGLLSIVFLFAAVSGFAIFKISVMKDNAQEISKNWMPSVAVMGWMNGAVSDVNRLNLAISFAINEQTMAKLEKQQKSLLQEIEQQRQVYERDMISSPEERKLYDEFSEQWDAYLAKVPAIMEAGKANNFELAKQRITDAQPDWEKANDSITAIINFNNDGGLKASQKSVDVSESAFVWVSIFCVSIAVLTIVLGWIVSNRIANSLRNMVDNIQEVANGNLTLKKVEITSHDEIGLLGTAVNTMTQNLRELITQVSQSSEQVAASSEQLTASSEQSAQATNQVAAAIDEVASGAEQQVQAVNATSAVVEQLSTGIQHIAANADTVTTMSDKTANLANDGSKAIDTAVGQMKQIEKAAINTAEVVSKLGEQSKKIDQIVAVISGIAGQTNLLALNAAIEAARAGEHGRGFAVVAEEVRKLAEQSQEAAKEIATLISEVQADTERAVVAMNEGTHQAKVGAEVVNDAGHTFKEIVSFVNQVSSEITEISAEIQHMAGGSQQIVSSVRNIDEICKASASQTQTVSAATEEQSASIEEIASSSQSLAQMAQQLQTAVSKFNV